MSANNPKTRGELLVSMGYLSQKEHDEQVKYENTLKESAVRRFIKNISKQVDMPKEFTEIINKNFYELF